MDLAFRPGHSLICVRLTLRRAPAFSCGLADLCEGKGLQNAYPTRRHSAARSCNASLAGCAKDHLRHARDQGDDGSVVLLARVAAADALEGRVVERQDDVPQPPEEIRNVSRMN